MAKGFTVKAKTPPAQKKEEFDIVLSDVHMPDIDGFKLLEQIALDIDIPVLMMSANADQSVVLRGIIHGAVDYLLKPVRIHELKNIWQHVVRKNGTDSLQRSASMSMSPRSGRGSPEKDSGMNVTEANKKLRTIAAVNSAVLTDTNAATKGNKKPSTVQGIAELSHQQQQQQQHTKKGKDNNTNTAPVPGQQQDQMNVTPYPNAGAAPGGAPGGAVAPGHPGGHPPLQSPHQQQQQQRLDGSVPPPVNMMGAYVENGMPPGAHPQYHPQGSTQQMGSLSTDPNMMNVVGSGGGGGGVDMNGVPVQANGTPGAGQSGGNTGGGSKKPRVVWSAELHQQFVNAVNQLGIDKAVPKRILDLMNVQGLTRENVASHLQKYRLYLKRLQGGPNNPGGPGFLSNKVAGSTTVPQNHLDLGRVRTMLVKLACLVGHISSILELERLRSSGIKECRRNSSSNSLRTWLQPQVQACLHNNHNILRFHILKVSRKVHRQERFLVTVTDQYLSTRLRLRQFRWTLMTPVSASARPKVDSAVNRPMIC